MKTNLITISCDNQALSSNLNGLYKLLSRKRILIFYLLYFGLSFQANAQTTIAEFKEKKTAHYFPLQEEDIQALIKRESQGQTIQQILTKRDRFYTDSATLPMGYYLKASVQQNKLLLQHIVRSDLQFSTKKTFNGMLISLKDSLGHPITPEKILLNGNTLAYNNNFKGFFYHSKESSNVLTVFYQGKKHIFLSKTSQYPIREDHKFLGGSFLWFNKPLYRSGDTLRFKAFLFDSTKNTYAGNTIRAEIWNYRTKLIDLGKIQSYRKGAFESMVVLKANSILPLDNHYQIKLLDSKANELLLENKYFEFSNRKTANFAIEIPRIEKWYRHENHSINFRIIDRNQIGALGGEVSITLKQKFNYGANQKASENKKDLFYRDTIMHRKGLLPGKNGVVNIPLPDSLIRATTNRLLLEIAYKANNEEIRANQHIHIFDDDDIVTTIQKDSLIVSTIKTGIKPQFVSIYGFSSYKRTLLKQGYTPIAVPLNYLYNDYGLSTERKKIVERIDGSSHEKKFYRVGDTVYFEYNNLLRQRMEYELFTENGVHDKGSIDSSNIRKSWKLSKAATLYLTNLGSKRTTSFKVGASTDSLQIQLDMPSILAPNKNITIDIAVKNKENLPQEGVDITATSIDSKLLTGRSTLNYTEESVPKRTEYIPDSLSDDNYSGVENDYALNLKTDLFPYFKNYDLKNSPYHDFIYTSSVKTIEVPSKESQTEMSVYVFNEGIQTYPAIVYIDNKPVYYQYSEPDENKTFSITPGNHSIQLRTANQLIELTNISFRKGYKTWIAVNDQAPPSLGIKRYPRPTRFTEKEINNLHEHMRFIKMPTSGDSPIYAYIKTGTSFIVINNQTLDTNPWVGPFPDKAPLNYYTIKANPYTYKQLGRLNRNWATPTLFTRTQLDNELEAIINYELSSTYRNQWKLSNTDTKNARVGYYIIPQQNTPPVNLAFVYPTGKSIKEGMPLWAAPSSNTIKAGFYNIFVEFKDKSYLLRKHVEVRPYGETQFYIDNEIRTTADSFSKNSSDSLRSLVIDNLLWKKEKYAFSINIKGRKKINGRVVNEKGKALPGAFIYIENQQGNTRANTNGVFTLMIPSDGKLVCNMPGYELERIGIKENQNYLFKLRPKEIKSRLNTRQSIIVEDNTVHDFASIEEARIAYPTTGSSNKIYVVAGVVYKTLPHWLKEEDIIKTEILKPEVALNLYGKEASAGAVVITTRKFAIREQDLERKHFADTAFWAPDLRTDKKGKASFTVKMPANITSWQTFATAMREDMITGWTSKVSRSFKPVSITISSPEYLITGDTTSVYTQVNNYKENAISTNSILDIDEKTYKNTNLSLEDFAKNVFPLTTGKERKISLKAEVYEADKLEDAEKKTIPVYQVVSVFTKGTYKQLNPGERFDYTAPMGDSLIAIISNLNKNNVIRVAKNLAERKGHSIIDTIDILTGALHFRKLTKNTIYDEKIKTLTDQLSKTIRLKNYRDRLSIYSLSNISLALLLAKQEGFNSTFTAATVSSYIRENLYKYSLSGQFFALETLLKLNVKLDYSSALQEYENRLKAANKLTQQDTISLRYLEQLAFGKTNIEDLMKRCIPLAGGGFHLNSRPMQNDNLLLHAVLKQYPQYQNEAMLLRNFLVKIISPNYSPIRSLYELMPFMVDEGAVLYNDSILRGNAPVKMIKPGERFSIKNQTNHPAYVTVIKRLGERYPIGTEAGIAVKTTIGNDPKKRNLQNGEKSTIVVDLKMKVSSFNIVVDVPLPAGVTYLPSYNGPGKIEFMKTKVRISIPFLAQGSYQLNIPISADFPGSYIMNATRAWLREMPLVQGNTEVKRIRINGSIEE